MKAAILLVILTVAASAQAFPGSQPATELVAAPSKSLALPLTSVFDSLTCVLGYSNEVVELWTHSVTGVVEAVNEVALLAIDLTSCIFSSNIIGCGVEALQNAWDRSEELRANAQELVADVLHLVKDVLIRCFSWD